MRRELRAPRWACPVAPSRPTATKSLRSTLNMRCWCACPSSFKELLSAVRRHRRSALVRHANTRAVLAGVSETGPSVSSLVAPAVTRPSWPSAPRPVTATSARSSSLYGESPLRHPPPVPRRRELARHVEPLSGSAIVVGAIVVVALLVLAGRDGWHRDELYFAACGWHLNWALLRAWSTPTPRFETHQHRPPLGGHGPRTC
jgi:hypothetical protein